MRAVPLVHDLPRPEQRFLRADLTLEKHTLAGPSGDGVEASRAAGRGWVVPRDLPDGRAPGVRVRSGPLGGAVSPESDVRG